MMGERRGEARHGREQLGLGSRAAADTCHARQRVKEGVESVSAPKSPSGRPSVPGAKAKLRLLLTAGSRSTTQQTRRAPPRSLSALSSPSACERGEGAAAPFFRGHFCASAPGGQEGREPSPALLTELQLGAARRKPPGEGQVRQRQLVPLARQPLTHRSLRTELRWRGGGRQPLSAGKQAAPSSGCQKRAGRGGKVLSLFLLLLRRRRLLLPPHLPPPLTRQIFSVAAFAISREGGEKGRVQVLELYFSETFAKRQQRQLLAEAHWRGSGGRKLGERGRERRGRLV